MTSVKRNKFLAISLAVFMAVLLTIISLKSVKSLPVPESTTWYIQSENKTTKSALNIWPINYQKNEPLCLAESDLSRTKGAGWPLKYRYEVDYGCPAISITPLSAAVDFIIFLLVGLIFAYMAKRLVRLASNSRSKRA